MANLSCYSRAVLLFALVLTTAANPQFQNRERGYNILPPLDIPNQLYNTPTVPPPTVPPPANPPRTPDTLYSGPPSAGDASDPSGSILFPSQQLAQPPSGSQLAPNFNTAPAPPPPQGGAMVGMPYEFEWQVNDIDSGNLYSHNEESDGTVTTGEYRVLLPDGRLQIVSFIDNGNGYMPTVTYEPYEGPFQF